MKADTSKTFLRPTLNRIIPRIGEQIEATIGCIPKIRPIIVLFTPLSFATPGKKGARTDWMHVPIHPSTKMLINGGSNIYMDIMLI